VYSLHTIEVSSDSIEDTTNLIEEMIHSIAYFYEAFVEIMNDIIASIADDFPFLSDASTFVA
jgi:hypothetical protein